MSTFAVTKRQEKLFHAVPENFVEETIQKFARSNPANHLESFNDELIFEKPLVGFADGDDPLFKEYKNVVHRDHFLPREFLELHLGEKPKPRMDNLKSISVISFVLPIHRKTIETNAGEKEGPSLRWNHTRWKGQEFINTLSNHLISVLEAMGYRAVAPELSPFYKMMVLPDGFASNWSQRHAAYAAGLGTFSLNDGFITARGQAMRCGSIITNLKLQSSVRSYVHYLENCLFYTAGKCGKCIERCPGGAIGKNGHDKLKCFETVFEKQKPWSEGAHGPGFIGTYAGCGLCQSGVPCSFRIPVKKKNRDKA